MTAKMIKNVLFSLFISLPFWGNAQSGQQTFSSSHYTASNIKMTNSIEKEQPTRGGGQAVSFFQYEFEVFPGGNPADVFSLLQKQKKMVLDRNGKILFKGKNGKLYPARLYAFQYDPFGDRKNVSVKLQNRNGRALVNVNPYEMAEILTIGIRPQR